VRVALSSGMIGMPREEPRRDMLVVVGVEVDVEVEGWLEGEDRGIEMGEGNWLVGVVMGAS